MAQGVDEIPRVEVEMHMVRLIHPLGKGHDHVEENLITISHQKWSAAHAQFSLGGGNKTVGDTPIASAQANKSG
jgi:hypothetical protein